MKELVKILCGLPGVSSWEDRVRDTLREQAVAHADALRVDALGNLIVEKAGRKRSGPKLLLTAHMDEVGLMVRQITDDGYLKFDAVGTIDRRVLIGKPVRVGSQGISGVIGLKAYHLVSRDEEGNVPKLDEFYIDIGAKDRTEAEAMVSLGDAVVFASDCVEFGDGLLKAKALESRVGCAALLTLLKEDLPMDCTFVFTAQEEVGARGAFGAAFSITPDIALALTGVSAGGPGLPEYKQTCALGQGVVIPYMDQGAVTDRSLFENLRTLAGEQEIPWQLPHMLPGQGETSALQRAKTGVRTAVLAVPVRYPHSPAGVACIRDMQALLGLTRAFVAFLAQED